MRKHTERALKPLVEQGGGMFGGSRPKGLKGHLFSALRKRNVIGEDES